MPENGQTIAQAEFQDNHILGSNSKTGNGKSIKNKVKKKMVYVADRLKAEITKAKSVSGSKNFNVKNGQVDWYMVYFTPS